MGKVIGIDLGTTNSVVAIMDGGEPQVIANEEGNRTTPSVVAWNDKGEILTGQSARRQSVTNPENTVHSVKRFMGRRYEETDKDRPKVPYKVVRGDTGGAFVEIRGKAYSAPEISARVLMKLKASAEAFLGEKITEAVITVPAYFNDAQRQATKDAGKIAGLDVRRIVNEPTAAALAYGLDKLTGQDKNRHVAIYDFGGGTFDISILEIGQDIVEVVSTNGDTHLGGDDIDILIADMLVAEFKKETGVDLSADKMSMQRLRDASEKAKIELSSVVETDVNLPFITATSAGPLHLTNKISRAKLESVMGDLLRRSIGPCKAALADAKKKPEEIDEVVLVGGSTRIPMVESIVKEVFGKTPSRGVNPDEVVALGAAVQAGVLTGEVKDLLLLDVTPLSLGIETQGGVMTVMIPRNTTIPTKKMETYSTAADNQPSVTIKVFQGERPMTADNRLLGRFELSGIPPAPRGMPQIEVMFDVDANGILSVSAKDRATGKASNVTITASSGLSKTDIERMTREAADNEAADKIKKEAAELRNKLDGLIIMTEKTLTSDYVAKVDETVKARVADALARAKEINTGTADTANIQAVYSELEGAVHAMTDAAYRQAAPQGAEPEPNGSQPNGRGHHENTQDAEYIPPEAA